MKRLDGHDGAKSSYGMVFLISLIAAFCLLCVHSNFFSFNTHTYSLWHGTPVMEEDGREAPTSSLLTEIQPVLQAHSPTSNTSHDEESQPLPAHPGNFSSVEKSVLPGSKPFKSKTSTVTAHAPPPPPARQSKKAVTSFRLKGQRFLSSEEREVITPPEPRTDHMGSRERSTAQGRHLPKKATSSTTQEPTHVETTAARQQTSTKFPSAEHVAMGKPPTGSPSSEDTSGGSHPHPGSGGQPLTHNHSRNPLAGRDGHEPPAMRGEGGGETPASSSLPTLKHSDHKAPVPPSSQPLASSQASHDSVGQPLPPDPRTSSSLGSMERKDAAASQQGTKTQTASTTQKTTRVQKPAIQKISSKVPSSHHARTGKQGGLEDNYTFPLWWTESWARSAVWEKGDSFVGDQPFFPSCLTSNDTWEAYPFVEPAQYVNSSKNPCWYEHPDKRAGLRCVPYFYLAGVAKGGTTDLFRRIHLHPQVFQGTMKEYHWWERFRFGSYDEEDLEDNSLDLTGGMTFRQYTDRLTGRGIYDLQGELRDTGSSVRLFGDFSPSYLWDPRNWYVLEGNQNCSEPRVIVGQHIRHVFPQAKVILTFRHPTPRLYSRFVSRTARTDFLRRATARDFHDYVLDGIRVYRQCFAQHSVRHCAYNVSAYKESVVRLVEGMYPVFMADWLRVWPRENLLLLRYEDYGGQEKQRLEEIFRFLGLAPLDSEAMEDLLSFDAVNSGSEEYHKVGPMLEETRAALDQFYQPFIQQLAHLLQDPRFLWKDVTH